MPLPEEVLKKVKKLDISTRKLVNNLFAGEYHTAFKGHGMTFAEFREYVPGDDVRSISWTLMARTGKPFIKKFDEERELTLMLAADVSGSGDFGSGKYLKADIIAYLSAILGFSASKNNDRVGLLLFSDEVEKFIPPKKGRAHVQRILSEILSYEPKSRGTKISVALEHMMNGLTKRSTIFLLSDFMDQNFYVPLRQLGRRHDTIAVVIQDPLELAFPPVGLVNLRDAESGEIITIDTSSPLVRKLYKEQIENSRKARDGELRRAAVDRIDVVSGDDFVDPLVAFFKKRHG
ncbi:MAG TPA: DUF58 domain-containing protein [Bdellovibrionales bacterium]|nr:DUF58 domain-containing protein [Bdellovibrionales bacterium]